MNTVVFNEESVVSDFAAKMVLHRKQETMAGWSEEDIERIRESARLRATALIADIQDQEACFRRLRNGTFHPDNRASRKVFERVTGLILPGGVAASQEAIVAWIGKEWVENKLLEERIARQKSEAEAIEKAKQKEADECEAIIKRIVAKERFSGVELVRAARHLGLDVHPRTAGVARAVEFNPGGDSLKTAIRTYNGEGMFHLRRLVIDAVEERSQEPEPE